MTRNSWTCGRVPKTLPSFRSCIASNEPHDSSQYKNGRRHANLVPASGLRGNQQYRTADLDDRRGNRNVTCFSQCVGAPQFRAEPTVPSTLQEQSAAGAVKGLNADSQNSRKRVLSDNIAASWPTRFAD